MNTVRKKYYETINNYAKENGMTFSEFLNKHCTYLSKKEQEEIESLNIDFENLNGKELSLDELLQD